MEQYLVKTIYPYSTRSTLSLREYNQSEIRVIRTKFLKFPKETMQHLFYDCEKTHIRRKSLHDLLSLNP